MFACFDIISTVRCSKLHPIPRSIHLSHPIHGTTKTSFLYSDVTCMCCFMNYFLSTSPFHLQQSWFYVIPCISCFSEMSSMISSCSFPQINNWAIYSILETLNVILKSFRSKTLFWVDFHCPCSHLRCDVTVTFKLGGCGWAPMPFIWNQD